MEGKIQGRCPGNMPQLQSARVRPLSASANCGSPTTAISREPFVSTATQQQLPSTSIVPPALQLSSPAAMRRAPHYPRLVRSAGPRIGPRAPPKVPAGASIPQPTPGHDPSNPRGQSVYLDRDTDTGLLRSCTPLLSAFDSNFGARVPVRTESHLTHRKRKPLLVLVARLMSKGSVTFRRSRTAWHSLR